MLIEGVNLFLVLLALVWVIGAILQDLRRREVDNVWNFSLIAVALIYRLAVSIETGQEWFFINGLLGFIIFLLLGNLFYYMRLFAGGDAKLLIALGTILPLSFDWLVNFKVFGWFILLFLFGGVVYVLIWSIFLVAFNLKRFNRELFKQIKSNNKFIFISLGVILAWLFVSYYIFSDLIVLGLIFLFFPILFIFAKTVEESCMIREIEPRKLTEGEWLYEDIFVGGKKISARWEGVSKSEIKLIREKYRRKVLIKQGIPFTPGFLIGLIGLFVIDWYSLIGI